MSEPARESLFVRLAALVLDPENDDPAEWDDDGLLRRVEDLVGEGWGAAGAEMQRLHDLARSVERECIKSRPSKQALRIAVQRAVSHV